MDDLVERHLLRATPDALWLLALDGSTLYGNDRLSALLGRPVDTLTAASIFDVTDDQGRQDLARHLAAMRSHHPGADNEEVLILRPDGSQVWTLVSWAPCLDDDGTLVGYLHRLTENTQRRALLDRLSRRESELEAAQAIAHLGSWSWDVVDGRVTWSTELYRIYGLDPSEHVASYEAFLTQAHPADRGALRVAIEQAVLEGEPFEHEGRVVTPAGQVRWVRSRGVVDRDRKGVVIRLHGTCQDVTDLQRAADDATQARRRLRLISSIAEAANRSDDLDVALGRAWAALESVEEWRSLAVWGRPDDPTGPPELLHDLTSPDRHLASPEAVAAVASWTTGRVSIGDSEEPGNRAVWLPVRLAGTTVRLIQLEGAVTEVDDAVLELLDQVSTTLSRVAEREQAAVELAAARDAAMAASAHKSAFLATMSHEIRTPMNGVIGLNDLLLRTDLDPHQRRLAEGLRGAGLTLLSLLNDILDLSKIEAGAVELEHTPFEVAQVLEQTATVVSPPAQEKQLELVFGCDPALPPTLVGDRVRLGQVLTNLASNAVKFTEQGEVVVELLLEPGTDVETGRVQLRGEVRDTGIGIGADAADLFEAFTQADLSTTRSHGGTGLGLAISRRLVHDMGGSIGADELPGGGSVFWFVVPLEVAPVGVGAPPRPALPAARVLVVDDNPRAARALTGHLVGWGLDVRHASTAGEALRVLLEAAGTEGAFDLALVDLHMPGSDGLALARAVTRRDGLAALPMVLLSDDPSTRLEDVAALGFGAVVDKPLRVSELHDTLLRMLRADQSRAAAGAPPRSDDEPQDRLALHVLVVEDNPVNQLVAQGLLERLGCTSAVAANGEEAVVALEPGHAYDLVLMDCRMPRMDGYTATARVRAREEGTGTRVPIVAMTASALEGERDRCLAAGMDDFMTKPVDTASLTRLVKHWGTVAGVTGDAAVDLSVDLSVDLAVDLVPGATRAVADGAVPVLDPERVQMLGELVRDGVSFFERTRASFLGRVDATVDSLRDARDRGDLPEVCSVAHALKGSALNLGLTRAGTSAALVERLAAAGDAAGAATAIASLELTLAEGVDALLATEAVELSP
jgi:PAS domain S-box-containing protein